ncbi:MAG TPA: nucleotide pyrophosphohydrolase [Gemmatimonadota bacterium]|nr:nucleotide pyrophosphohydrolase [Gemmatimonadota bacterium]
MRDPMPTDHDTVIAELKAEIQSFCEARDWDQFHGAKDLSIAIATEASELLELFRFARPEDVEEQLDQGRAEIHDELADVLIFVLRFAQRFDFDLAQAVRAKLAVNERRYPVEVARGSNRKAP